MQKTTKGWNIFFSSIIKIIIIIPVGVRPLVVREILALLPLLFFIAVFDDHEHECTMMMMMGYGGRGVRAS